MRKIFNKLFLFGIVMGVLLSLLVSHVLGFKNQNARHTSDNHSNPNDTFIEITDSMLLEMKENGAKDKHTYEKYKEGEIRYYFEYLYGYAKESHIIDSTMTFEEFMQHPLCRDTIGTLR